MDHDCASSSTLEDIGAADMPLRANFRLPSSILPLNNPSESCGANTDEVSEPGLACSNYADQINVLSLMFLTCLLVELYLCIEPTDSNLEK